MSVVAQISLSRANEDLQVFFDVTDLPTVLDEALPEDHVTLQPGDYSSVAIDVPANVYLTVLPGAIINYNTLTGATQNIADLNKLSDYLNHISNESNPHSVDGDDVGRNIRQWNADRIADIQVNPDAVGDGKALVYDASSGTIIFDDAGADFSLSTTDDLDEGVVNLYFTEQRVLDTVYTVPTVSSIDNIKEALDHLLNPLSVSFSITNGTVYEVGDTFDTLQFSYSCSSDDATVTLTGPGGFNVSLSPTGTSGSESVGPFTDTDVSSRTYTLEADDDGNTQSRSRSVNFRIRRFWGVNSGTSINSSDLDGSFFDNELSNGKTQTKSFDMSQDGGSNYWWFAWPASFGDSPRFYDDDTGFEVTFTQGPDITYTNAFSVTKTYYTFRGDTQSSATEINIRVENS